MAKGVAALSGGWKMKLALVRAMLQKADILLLDEPTNHLDVHNVAWLQVRGTHTETHTHIHMQQALQPYSSCAV